MLIIFTGLTQAKDLLIYDAYKFVYLDYAGDRVNAEMGEEDEEFNEQIRGADIMLIITKFLKN